MSDPAIEAEVERQLAVLRAGTVEFYGEDDLRARLEVGLREDRPLRVKLELGAPLLGAEFGNSRRFLDEGTAIQGFGLKNGTDPSLLDE